MSNNQSVRCPSWCAEHIDPDEFDNVPSHSAPSTFIEYRDGRKPIQVDLYGDDYPDRRTTHVGLDLGAGMTELSATDAARLGIRLVLTAARGVIGQALRRR
ncbi:hypothetical protein AB0L97_32900 [Nocardia sp. NPDC051911]|uniref:DUF6907 domain-containing protein n=1 Tax=Nocardia sp. NPDC051911 TaxID=3154648 RepID=UPI00342387A5